MKRTLGEYSSESVQGAAAMRDRVLKYLEKLQMVRRRQIENYLDVFVVFIRPILPYAYIPNYLITMELFIFVCLSAPGIRWT
jgi:hypothetical protein